MLRNSSRSRFYRPVCVAKCECLCEMLLTVDLGKLVMNAVMNFFSVCLSEVDSNGKWNSPNGSKAVVGLKTGVKVHLMLNSWTNDFLRCCDVVMVSCVFLLPHWQIFCLF